MDYTNEGFEAEYAAHVRGEGEWEKFHEQLKNVPHSFIMQHQEMLKPKALWRLEKMMRDDLESGLKTDLDIARTKNLLAYVLFSLDRSQSSYRPSRSLSHDALRETEEALKTEGEGHNLVSLANMAVILWHLGRRGEAEEQVRRIQGMEESAEDYEYLVVKAKAELAFSYTCMGPGRHFFQHAEKLFSEVIPKAREPDVWIWQFGLGMGLRRVLNVQFPTLLYDSNVILKEKMVRILRLLLEVARNSPCPSLKANAYAEMALLLQMSNMPHEISSFLQNEAGGISHLKAVEAALQLDDNCSTVLWKCGKVYRYSHNLDKACELLEKSARIRPVTQTFHHLGLAFKSKAEEEARRRGNISGRGRQVGRGRGRHVGQPDGSRTCRTTRQVTRTTCRTTRQGRGRHLGQLDSPDNWEQWHYPHTHWGREVKFGWPTFEQGGNPEYDKMVRRGRFEQTDRGLDTNLGEPGRERGRNCEYRGRARQDGNRGNTVRRAALNRQQSGRGWLTGNPQSHGTGDDVQTTGASLYGGGENREIESSKEPRVSQNPRRERKEALRGERENRGSGKARGRTAGEADEVVDTFVADISQLSPRDQFAVGGDSPLSSCSDGALYVDDDTNPAQDANQYAKLDFMKRIVKSSARNSTHLVREDPFVQQSVNCLEKAVTLGFGENYLAVQDLALMHWRLGDLEKALELMERIPISDNAAVTPLAKVTAYEHAGLILKEMSEKEEDAEKKKTLDRRGDEKLYLALLSVSKLCPKIPATGLWESFHKLLKAANKSQNRPHEKILEKAKLFRLISNHRHSVRLLQIVDSMSPGEQGDPTRLKMFIENYVGLQQYQEALTFIKILQQTRVSGAAMDLFEDKHYVQKVYILAAKQALMGQAMSTHDSKVYFSSAFQEIYRDDNAVGTSEDSVTTEDANEVWDVMIIYDDSTKKRADKQEDTTAKTLDTDRENGASGTSDMENKYALEEIAERLAIVLTNVCGLKVTCMDKHVLLGKLKLEGVVRVMRKSRLIVVLAGAAKVSSQFCFYIEQAAMRKSTVVLLAGGSHVPKSLKTHRSTDFSAELLTFTESLTCSAAAHVENSQASRPSNAEFSACPEAYAENSQCRSQSSTISDPAAQAESNRTRRVSEDIVKIICDLFGFLINVRDWSRLG